jgi:hypothetical protein
MTTKPLSAKELAEKLRTAFSPFGYCNPRTLEEVAAALEAAKPPVSELKWEGDFVSAHFIAFRRIGVSKSGKTLIWGVEASEDGVDLGQVKWYGPWRKYVFEHGDNVYEQVCLRDIAQFCEELTKEHKDRLKALDAAASEGS